MASYFLRYLLRAVSQIAFIPALIPLYNNRRHFAFFVGTAQLVAASASETCDALELQSLFLKEQDWHVMSDVLSLTYALLLLLHLSGSSSETTVAAMRYCAFWGAWVCKLRDSWDSVRWEAALVAVFLFYMVWSHVSDPRRRLKFKMHRVSRGIVAGGVALFFFGLAELVLQEQSVWFSAALCLVHVFAGVAAFELLSALPAPDELSGQRGGGGLTGAGLNAPVSFV